MALVASVDYPNKRIHLTADTVDANLDTILVYQEVRALRVSTEAHRQYAPIIEAGGNLEKVAGVSYTLPYARLLLGCRIVPYNTSHKIRLIRDTFTDDGYAGRDCFDRTPLTAGVEVDIDVDIQEVEVRVVTVGGDVITGDPASVATAVRTELAAELTRVTEFWRRHGLDIAAPLTQTPTEIAAGDISLAITGDENVSVTVTRQP